MMIKLKFAYIYELNYPSLFGLFFKLVHNLFCNFTTLNKYSINKKLVKQKEPNSLFTPGQKEKQR